MTKYGIISDTHIDRSYNREKLSLLLEQLREIFEGVDQIFHAGDITENFFLDELSKIAPVRAVNGHTNKIDGLEDFILLKIQNYKIGIIHKLPEDNKKLESFCRKNELIGGILIFGHTHQPLIKGTPFNTLLLNPGSPTHPKAPDEVKGFNKPKAKPSVILLTIENEIVTSIIVNLTTIKIK